MAGALLGGLIGALPGLFLLTTAGIIVDNEATEGGGLFYGVVGSRLSRAAPDTPAGDQQL